MSQNSRVAFLISGGGTTMQAAIQAILDGKLSGILPAVVVASSNESGGLEKAKALGIPTAVIDKKQFGSPDVFGQALLQTLQAFGATLISQNGWLPLTPKSVIHAFQGKIINQHPGPLDPGRGGDFGGTGMYGARVICARMIYEWLTNDKSPWTEATVHFVTEQFDKGDLIHTTKSPLPACLLQLDQLQRVHDDVDAQAILKNAVIDFQKSFLPVEHQTVIEALQLFGKGDIPKGFRREKPLVPSERSQLLEKSKKLAIELFPKG